MQISPCLLIPGAKYFTLSWPLQRLDVSRSRDKWSQCKQSRGNKCISDLCRSVMPNMPSAPFLGTSPIVLPRMSWATRTTHAFFFLLEGGMHHLMLSGLFFSRLTDNGWQLCLPRLDWVGTEKWKSTENWKCMQDLRRPTGALSGRWLKPQICTLSLLH